MSGVDDFIDDLADFADDCADCDPASWATVENRERCYDVLALIAAARTRIQAIADDLEEAICKTIPHGETILIHGRPHRVSRDRKYRGWQNDDLLRAVLDSRRVDKTTGEIADETPVDKIRDVWPLAGYHARLKGLRERGVQVDEYCQVEDGRLRLREQR